MSARYITTTLPYVNADPHIGFALELVQADALARAWRLAGDDVFFSTGTDEHGQKIYEAAEKAGQSVQDYVHHYAAEFQRLGAALNLSNDAFIRTTDQAHVAAAQEMWRLCSAGGDIYKKTYSGLYCVGCESFKTEKELVNGRCPVHPNLVPEKISEENYFFRFSKYQDQLLSYLEHPDSIIPDWRRAEAVAFVKGGLEDFSVSRETKRLSWGIPVPNDDSQVMYVWFDALTNYVSALGWPSSAPSVAKAVEGKKATEGKPDLFRKFWIEGKTLQMAGKDQVRFQSLMWQAMLMSAGVKNTDIVFYHGFVTSGGQKMSKSLGNVISPYELVEKYGTDATRYILLRHMNPMEDSDVTRERLDEWYTANLVNGLGNLVARVMKLAEDNLEAPVDTSTRSMPEVREALNSFHFNKAMDSLWSYIQDLDEQIQEEKPFEVVKMEKSRGQKQISFLVTEVARIAEHLAPFMPATSETIKNAVLSNKKPDNLFPRI